MTDVLGILRICAFLFETAVVDIGDGIQAPVMVPCQPLGAGVSAIRFGVEFQDHECILRRIGGRYIAEVETETCQRVVHLVTCHNLDYILVESP